MLLKNSYAFHNMFSCNEGKILDKKKTFKRSKLF